MWETINNTPDSTASMDPADARTNKVMGIFAYCSWMVLVPLFAAKDSKFARFHTNQGLTLAIAETGWWILEGILAALLWRWGFFLSFFLWLPNLAFMGLTALGIVNAAKGKAKELPIIGKFKLLK